VIEETPQHAWAITGRPQPDLAFLTGDEYLAMMERAKDIMRDAIREPTSLEQKS
jgi:hypothetical protein